MTGGSKVRLRIYGHGIATAFRTIIFFLLLGLIIYTWYSSFMHSGQHARSEFAWYVVAVVALLAALFVLEAMEIAYTRLRDKLLDQFQTDAERNFFLRMKKDQHVVYEAREWLVIMIIAAITLIAEIGTGEGLFVGRYPVKPQFLFPIIFASLPVIWFAQGPGKELANRLPRWVLFGPIGRLTWPCVRAVSFVVEWTGLNIPAGLVPWCLKKTPKESNPPSDQELFLQSVHRYGFALHHLDIRVDILPDGSCRLKQSFLIYLLRYPRRNFKREVFFDSDAIDPRFSRVEGYYRCPRLEDSQESYDSICKLLEQIREGTSDLEAVKDERLGTREASIEAGHVRFEIETYRSLPEGESAAAIAVVCEGNWKPGAMKVQHGEEDSFQQSFRYPCRTYRLEIVPDPSLDLHFSRIVANAKFMWDPHTGEAKRLESAREPDNERIVSSLNYPLPGAEYEYCWHVARGKKLN